MNKRCQVFTPQANIIELLDRVGYINNLFGKKVIENACGDGGVLVAIVERYIIDCLNTGMELGAIKLGLEADIYGAEIDLNHYNTCISNLNYIAQKYSITNVSWKIFNVDILKAPLQLKFDYVIGNPPYINHRELDIETREYLKTNYEVCADGKFDYCYAFIEASLKSLSDTGKLSYLIPSSIFKNVFAQKLRDYLLPSLTKIYDYTTLKLFDNAIISSAIIIVDKGNKTDAIEYFDIKRKISYFIEKQQLTNKWLFSRKTQDTTELIKRRFGDYFTASVTIATLLNEAFVISDFTKKGKYIISNGNKIEKTIVRETVSPRSLNEKKNSLIIFPYKYPNGVFKRYSEKEFLRWFPETAKYLMLFSDKLEKRNSADNVKWFEYGRSQALSRLDQEKLLISQLVTGEVRVHELDKECIPYSGLIIVKNGVLSLTDAKKILESKAFYEYVQNIGVPADGSSFRISPVDINNFEFIEEEI